MNNISLILEFVISLSLLLFVHELGHFAIGRLMGIKADEFGFGYPPQILKLFTWKGTDFTINLIPFGAFVRFSGEDDPTVEGGFYAANKWKRLAVLLSGPLMNIITGVLLFSLVVSNTGMPKTDTVEIVQIAPNSPAAQIGLLPSDIITHIDDIEITSIADVGQLVQERVGTQIDFAILRDGEEIIFLVTPRTNPPQGEGSIGIVMQNPTQKVSILKSIPVGAQIAVEQVRQLLSVPAMLIRGEVASQDARMLSPIGIYDVYSQVRQEEQSAAQPDYAPWLDTAWFFGVISVSLGFSNLLPIPALDGGRILFILPEIFLKKRIPAKYENFVHFVGYVSLLALMGYVFFQDIINPIVLP
jgi:regulator of sigma E protease